MFKVGDRVRVIKSSISEYIGKVGTIKEIFGKDKDLVYVKMNNKKLDILATTTKTLEIVDEWSMS